MRAVDQHTTIPTRQFPPIFEAYQTRYRPIVFKVQIVIMAAVDTVRMPQHPFGC